MQGNLFESVVSLVFVSRQKSPWRVRIKDTTVAADEMACPMSLEKKNTFFFLF
jgi:hypothetical protein